MMHTATTPVQKSLVHRIQERVKKGWYTFSKNPLSVVGAVIIFCVVFIAFFAPIVSPYPEHAGNFVDFDNASQPPSKTHLFGTDVFGRDILTRVFFGFRLSLIMGVVVISLTAPVGVTLGLIAGYKKNTWVETLIMRITDIFVAVPPLILALAVAAILTPNIFNSMMAVSLMWWPWYCRMVYGIASSHLAHPLQGDTPQLLRPGVYQGQPGYGMGYSSGLRLELCGIGRSAADTGFGYHGCGWG
jgi:peptide/nickel transport system permease protein